MSCSSKEGIIQPHIKCGDQTAKFWLLRLNSDDLLIHSPWYTTQWRSKRPCRHIWNASTTIKLHRQEQENYLSECDSG